MASGRTLTVPVADVVSSTALFGRLGVDRADGARRALFNVFSKAIRKGDGVLIKTMGDGCLASFAGAADAVTASIALQQAVARLRQHDVPALGLRVGLAVGDVTEEDDDVFGPAVVTASRLCGAAGEHQILATDMVRMLAGDRGGHHYDAVGELMLNGIAEPVRACAVGVDAETGDERLFPASLAALSAEPMVGRGAELAVLTTALTTAGTGERRAVLVAGEPGVGKTRLVAALARRAHADGALVLFGRCDEDVAVAFQPVAEAMRAGLAGFDTDVMAAHVAAHGGEIHRLVPAIDAAEPVAAGIDITGRLHVWRGHSLMVLGRRGEFETNRAHIRERGETTGDAFLLGTAHGRIALLALLDGRFGDVSASADRMLEAKPTDEAAHLAYFGLSAAVANEEGRAADLLPLMEAGRTVSPDLHSIHAAWGRGCLENGDHTGAAEALGHLSGRWSGWARDSTWPFTLAETAELVAGLEATEHAGMIADELAPYAGELVVVGHMCIGAFDRYRGMLLSLLGCHDEAVAALVAAQRLEVSVESPPLVARTRYWLARALLHRNSPGDREHATTELDRSIATAERLGMRALALAGRELAEARDRAPLREVRAGRPWSTHRRRRGWPR